MSGSTCRTLLYIAFNNTAVNLQEWFYPARGCIIFPIRVGLSGIICVVFPYYRVIPSGPRQHCSVPERINQIRPVDK